MTAFQNTELLFEAAIDAALQFEAAHGPLATPDSFYVRCADGDWISAFHESKGHDLSMIRFAADADASRLYYAAMHGDTAFVKASAAAIIAAWQDAWND